MNIKTSPVAQKLKGKAQKAIGEFQQASGHGIKGGIMKAKGELNERVADARMKLGKKKLEVRDELEENL